MMNLLYPFELVQTMAHETAHALVALASGAKVKSLVVDLDGSGYVITSGGNEVLIAASGYLGAAALGYFLVTSGRRNLIAVIFGWVALLLAAFYASTLTMLSLALLASLACAFYGTSFIHAALKAVGWLIQAFNLMSIFVLLGFTGHSDASVLTKLTGVPQLIWIIAWAAFSAMLIVKSLRRKRSYSTL